MKYLITGTAGFIGSHLAHRLLHDGHDVVGVDCLTDYYHPGLKQYRLDCLRQDFPHLDHVNIDISDQDALATIEADDFDHIIHLAAQPGVRLSPSEYGLYYTRNLLGTANLLRFATVNGIQRVLYASSSSVYGDNATRPFSESQVDLTPVSIYGTTKLATEVLAKGSSTADGLTTRGLRFFTVYGSMGRPDMAYFRLIAAALGTWDFRLYGDGGARRDFTHVSDTVEGICRLADDLTLRPPGFHDIVNVGGGNTRSMADLISTIENLAGARIDHQQTLRDSRDVAETEADFAYLQEITGFRPTVQLEEGLIETIEWAKQSDVVSRLRGWIENRPLQ